MNDSQFPLADFRNTRTTYCTVPTANYIHIEYKNVFGKIFLCIYSAHRHRYLECNYVRIILYFDKFHYFITVVWSISTPPCACAHLPSPCPSPPSPLRGRWAVGAGGGRRAGTWQFQSLVNSSTRWVIFILISDFLFSKNLNHLHFNNLQNFFD